MTDKHLTHGTSIPRTKMAIAMPAGAKPRRRRQPPELTGLQGVGHSDSKKVLTSSATGEYGETSPLPARSGAQAVNGIQPLVSCGVTEPLFWYLLRVYRPFGEDFKVAREIAKLGYRAHLPQYVTYKVLKKFGRPVFEDGRKVEVESIRSLYPGYMFVSFVLSEPGWGRILQVPGVTAIMCRRTEAAMVPVIMPMGLVERLMNQGRAGDGVIDERKPSFPVIDLGETVRVNAGPFEGHTGILQMSDRDRVGVLLSVFGADQVVSMDRRSVALLSGVA